MRTTLAVLAILAATPVGAASLQEQYAAAQAAFDAGKLAEARSGFAVILPRLDANPKMKLQAAIVRARMGTAAGALGEPEAAAVLIKAALPVLDAKSPDWMNAMLDLGAVQEQVIDFDGAARSYRAVLAASTMGDGSWLSATIGAARVLTFSDPAAARGYADEALRVGATVFADKGKRDSYAQLLALRGRIDLNAGDAKAARVWLDRALNAAGGLGTRVSAADVRIRGDLGLTAYMARNFEDARKFLAYTGAGSLPSQGFELGADMPLPACAPVGDVRRDDMAIIEFAIADDGRVVSVAPIYATGGGVAALSFARAVRAWSWQQDAAKKLPAFWRQNVRFELRCSSQPPDPSAGRFDPGRLARSWLAEHAPEPLPDIPEAAAAGLAPLRAELGRRTAAFGGQSPQLLPVLLRIERNTARSNVEGSKALAAAAEIARAANAPADLRNFIRLRQAEVDALDKQTGAAQARVNIPRIEALIADLDASGAGQTRIAAMAAMRLAVWAAYLKDRSRITAAYRRILATPLDVVADGDPLRQSARLQLASTEAAATNLEQARALLAETGLSAEQCSAFPITPLQTSRGLNGRDFPEEALRWGFDGKVKVAFDIGTDGRPLNVRTVLAMPPFVFNEATEALTRRSRYEPIFRDGQAIACVDQQRSQGYRIAR